MKPKAAGGRASPPGGSGLWEGFSPPEGLKDDGLAEFNRLVANLRRAGTLDRTDPQLVVAAVRTWILLDAVFSTLADEGITTVGGHGSPMAHPLLPSVNSLTMRLRGLYSDMGLTAASSKNGTQAKDEPAGNKWGDLLSVTG